MPPIRSSEVKPPLPPPPPPPPVNEKKYGNYLTKLSIIFIMMLFRVHIFWVHNMHSHITCAAVGTQTGGDLGEQFAVINGAWCVSDRLSVSDRPDWDTNS